MRIIFTILVGVLAYLFVGGIVLAILDKWHDITPESDDWYTEALAWPVIVVLFIVIGPMHNIALAGYKIVNTIKKLWKNESRQSNRTR